MQPAACSVRRNDSSCSCGARQAGECALCVATPHALVAACHGRAALPRRCCILTACARPLIALHCSAAPPPARPPPLSTPPPPPCAPGQNIGQVRRRARHRRWPCTAAAWQGRHPQGHRQPGGARDPVQPHREQGRARAGGGHAVQAAHLRDGGGADRCAARSAVRVYCAVQRGMWPTHEA